jgi:excisionase family DNA binding protein
VAENANNIMTVEDVADYLKVTTATIYRLAQKGDLPGAKVGRVWRFRKAAIDRFLQEQECVPVENVEQEQ